MNDVKKNLTNKPHSRGGRNLALLGLGSIVIALALVSLSIVIYRATGDIYLDRSRPGYISEDEKHEEELKENSFSNEGSITSKDLDLYMDQLEHIEQYLDASADVFSDAPLSDDALAITPDDVEPSAE